MMEVNYVQHCGNDLIVANAARVSFAKKTQFEPDGSVAERDAKLIGFLAKHRHLSPFNHTFVTLHIKAPLFVARQLVKHEYMPWNEVSGRYVTFEPEFYVPSLRTKAADKKQGSGPEFEGLNQCILQAEFITAQEDAFIAYKKALDAGVCEEQARILLPLGLMTEWYWSGTLGAWAKMYGLRAAKDTQMETQFIAREAGKLIEPLFPHAWKALTCS